MDGNHLVEVLIVEDNPGDVCLIEEMLQELNINLKTTVAKDGHLAIDMLTNKRNDLPDLIILDLNLPKVNGYDVLNLVKADNSIRVIPVVVMTGSLRKEDEERSREMGAADYCIKPGAVEEMERTTMCLRSHIELLPSKGKSRGSGRSAYANLDPLLSQVRDQWILPPCIERSITDIFNIEFWGMWK